MLIGAFGLFFWETHRAGADLAGARTVVVNVVVIVEIFYLLNCRSLTRSMFAMGAFSNPWVVAGIGSTIVSQLLFTYAPIMNKLFHSAPIASESWLRIVAVGVIVFAAVELEKWIRFGWHRK
jgi:magnesium-transporting ATPase (P-type)